jgi:type IV secretion system protein VirD4
MPAIARSAGFARGFGLHFSFVVQSRRQIEELYRNRGEASLLDNLGAEIFFGTDNRQLCEEASARAGYDTVAATSRSRPRFLAVLRQKEQNETTHPHRRALLLPQEIRTLPAGTALMFRGAAPPFLLHRLTWYRDRLFRPLQGRPDLAPALAFSTERDDGSLPVAAVVPAGPRRRRMPAALRVPPGTP